MVEGFVGNGSSPHTRGAPFDVSVYLAVGVDHPRIRGEHHLLMAPTRF